MNDPGTTLKDSKTLPHILSTDIIRYDIGPRGPPTNVAPL